MHMHNAFAYAHASAHACVRAYAYAHAYAHECGRARKHAKNTRMHMLDYDHECDHDRDHGPGRDLTMSITTVVGMTMIMTAGLQAIMVSCHGHAATAHAQDRQRS